MIKFDFGPVSDKQFRMSPYGIAVATNANGWVSYNPKTGEVFNVDIINFDISKLIYKMPVASNAIAIGDKDLTSIDSLEFDGNAIKYWANYCGDDIKAQEPANGVIYLVAQQHALMFDGNTIDDKIVQTVRNATGGGQFTCDDE